MEQSEGYNKNKGNLRLLDLVWLYINLPITRQVSVEAKQDGKLHAFI